MSNTPETDANTDTAHSWVATRLGDVKVVPRDFARRLERQRDEAREERDRYKRMWDESRMETVEAAK